MGYFYSINSGNGAAFGKLGEAIRAYVTRNLTRQPCSPPPLCLPTPRTMPAGIRLTPSAHPLVNPWSTCWERGRIRFANGNLLQTTLATSTSPSFTLGAPSFAMCPRKACRAIATVMLLAPNREGRFVEIGGTQKRIPTWLAFTEMALVAWFLLALIAILLYAPFWLIGGFFKKRRRPAERTIRLWPLIGLLSLVVFCAVFMASSSDLLIRLGNLTVWSAGLCLTSALFGVAALFSVIALWRARNREIRRFVRWHSIAVTAGLLIAALYMAWWD